MLAFIFHSRLGSLLLCCAIVLITAGCTPSTGESPEAVAGVIDLRKANLDHVIDLSGDWKAVSEDNPGFADYSQDVSEWRDAHVPGRFKEHGFPRDGIAWYRLKILLPKGARVSGAIENAGNSHEIYASTPSQPATMLAGSGRVSQSIDRLVLSRKPVTFALPQDSVVVLSWRVANVDYAVGGPFYPVRLGSTEALMAKVSIEDRVEFAVFWAYLVIGFFFFVNWLGNRIDVQSLSVGLLSFGMAMRTAAISGQLEYLFVAMDFRFRILLESTSFFFILTVFPLVLWAFFPAEFASIRIGKFSISPGSQKDLFSQAGSSRLENSGGQTLRLVNTGTMAISTVFGLSVLSLVWIVSVETTSYILVFARYFALILIVAGLAIVIQAFRRKRPMAGGVLASILILFAGFVNDILVSMGTIDAPEVSGYGFMIFLMSLSFVVARRNRRQMESLHDAMFDAEEANVAKSQFITSISHELRTPLTIVMGYSQILDSELQGVAEPHHIGFIKEIRESGLRLLMLVNDLLDLAKAETGKLDLSVSDVDASQIVRETASQIRTLTDSKGIFLEIDGADESLWIRADPARYAQIVLNLLSNAIKFTNHGGITVELQETTLGGYGAVRLEVRDTGIGISRKFVNRVFEQFTQEKSAYETTYRGTGIGLALSKEMVERMDGEIGVDSELGRGSVFWVTLPVAPHRKRNSDRKPIRFSKRMKETAVGKTSS